MDHYSSQIIINSHLEAMRAEGARSRAARSARRTAPKVSIPSTPRSTGCRMAQPTRRRSLRGAGPPAAVLAARLMALAMIGDVTRRVTSPEFIGRTDELELLRHALAETADGHASHILIAGEAGVGKSRLTAEAAAMARDSGWQVLIGGCLDMGEGGLPFGPYADLLRSWVRDIGRPGALAYAGTAAADLGRLVPELRPRDAAPTQDRWVQARIHDALFDLLRAYLPAFPATGGARGHALGGCGHPCRHVVDPASRTERTCSAVDDVSH